MKKPFLLSLLHLGFVIASYLFIVWPFFSNTYNVRYDNWEYAFRCYTYDSNSLLHGFGLPRWYPYDGGVPEGILHVTGLRVTPYGILGDFLYIILPLEPMTAYKINIALSVIIIGIGWWLFLYQLIGSRSSATVGCLTLLLGMTSVMAFDLEQVIASMLYIPWTLLVLIQIKKQFEFILILAVIIGLSVSVRYPIYHVLSLLFLFLSLILTGKLNFLFTAEIIKKKIFVLLFSFVLLVAAASPTIYTAKVLNDFYSPLDKSRIIEPKSFEEYARRAQIEPQLDINGYLDPHIPSNLIINHMPSKITFVQMILVVIGAFYYRFSVYAIIVLIFSVWATLGLAGSFPYILYTIKFPFVKYYRAWWEFSCAINLCLSYLASLGVASLLYLSRKAVSSIYKTTDLGMVYNTLLVGILSAVVIVPLIYFSKINANIYVKYFPDWPDLEVPRFDKKQFTEALKSNLFEKVTVAFLYTEWWDLLKECPELTTPQTTSKPPFITRTIYNNVNSHSDFKVYLKPFYNLGLYNYSVIASIPLEEAKDIKLDIREIPEDWVFNDSNLIKNHYFHVSEFQVSPYGITLEMQAPETAMAVLPYNYKLGLKVYLNNKRVKTYPVYDGAMIGVFLPEGKSNLYAKMPFSLYEFTISIQAILIVFVFVYLISDSLRKNDRVNGKFLGSIMGSAIILFSLTLIGIWVIYENRRHQNITKQIPSTATAYAVFNMDADTKHEIADSKGGHNAISFNARIVKGDSGKARYFNGKDSYIQTPVNVQGWKGLTISLWVKPECKGGDGLSVILDNGHDEKTNFAIQSADASGEKWVWHCNGIDIFLDIPLNQWSNVVVVADGEKGIVRAYTNGSKVTEVNAEKGFEFGPTQLTIGKLAKADTRYFKGSINRVVIWDTAIEK
ncbi:MAG: LamG domain-containing protein [Candidatus Brocadiales bacterium]|nr:LamG domain-containing protein [Candidatus Brocadiales bacterium]